MYQIVINLGNRKEYITYHSKWAGVLKVKEIGKCADVPEVYMLSPATGEIIIHYQNQECVWIDEYGEL